MPWVHNDAWHYLCSMPSLGVTLCFTLGRKGTNSMESVDASMAFNDVTEDFCDSKIQDILLPFCACNYKADKPSSINESINLLERFNLLL